MYTLTRCHLRCSASPTASPPPTPVPPQLSPPPRLVSPPHISHDPTLCSTWPHRAWVAAGSTSILTALARSLTTESPLSPLLAALLAYALADLSTGVYHWAIDNYGGPHTPLFGPQIAAFQGHHRSPSTITRRHFANNLHALARVVSLTLGPIELAAAASGSSGDATLHAFVGAFAGCVMMSQQFHAWAHTNKRRLPAVVAALQEAGVLISTARHTAHHRAPYNNNLHALARVVSLTLGPIELAAAASGSSGDATLHAFVGAFAGCVMMSQQFHAWAHTNKRRLPAVVAALQEAGVLISTARHAAHHRAPYNNNYCIVSGMWNGWLDEMKVFEAAEMVVFFRFGVRPRSWSEPGKEWTEEGGAEASTAVSAGGPSGKGTE